MPTRLTRTWRRISRLRTTQVGMPFRMTPTRIQSLVPASMRVVDMLAAMSSQRASLSSPQCGKRFAPPSARRSMRSAPRPENPVRSQISGEDIYTVLKSFESPSRLHILKPLVLFHHVYRLRRSISAPRRRKFRMGPTISARRIIRRCFFVNVHDPATPRSPDRPACHGGVGFRHRTLSVFISELARARARDCQWR
jgi:hypothetical protein